MKKLLICLFAIFALGLVLFYQPKNVVYADEINEESVFEDMMTEEDFLNDFSIQIPTYPGESGFDMVEYFKKLYTYSPINSHGSCGYVSLIQYLSYYDTFYNDSFIPEIYERNQGSVSSVASAINVSPGVLRQSYPTKPSLYQFIQENKNNDFQMKLMDILNSSKGRSSNNYTPSTGMWEYYHIFDELYTSFDVEFSYVRYKDFGTQAKPTDDNVVSFFDNYVKDQIDLGNPVILHIAKYDNLTNALNNYHSVVAYYYDELGIYANFGWGVTSTAMLISDEYQITEVGVIDFTNIPKNHSNNYIINNVGYCGCGEYNINFMDENNLPFSGSNHENQPTTHTLGNNSTLLDPTKIGYTFGGWYLTSNCQGESITELSGMGYSDDITLYAKWTANEYDISYYDQGGETFSGNLEDVPTTHTYDTETELPIAKKYLYDVEGWYLTSDCTGNPITSLSATGYTADITLYAKWTYATYTINYVSRVTIEGEYTHTYNTETVLIVPSSPIYTFHGWYLTSNYSGEPITVLSATGYTDDITLYGKWTETEFTLTYYDLDGNLLTGTQIEGFPTVYRYEQYLELPQLDTSKYTLFGWCIDSSDGVARDYLYTTYYRDLSLYATWELGGVLKIDVPNENWDCLQTGSDGYYNHEIVSIHASKAILSGQTGNVIRLRIRGTDYITITTSDEYYISFIVLTLRTGTSEGPEVPSSLGNGTMVDNKRYYQGAESSSETIYGADSLNHVIYMEITVMPYDDF